ncbi:MAG: histidine kinase [Bacteroidota bacterium]
MSVLKTRIFGVKISEWIALVLFYSFFGFAYQMTIYLTSSHEQVFFHNMLLDYSLKALVTLPIWLLVFRLLKDWEFWKKAILHIFLLVAFILVWQNLYYSLCEPFGLKHLPWPFAWWDVYIPGLFYVLQFGIFHVYDFYHRLQCQHKVEIELRQAAVQAELTALKSQLNPHFLYNTFNTISASVPPGQEHTRELIAKLADMFRYQLKGSKADLVSIHEELDFLKIYLELEKARFGDRLQFQFDIDTRVEHAMVPPMILQPLVENAVKHGISPKIEGGNITVSVFPKGDKIQFEISDSGVGLNANSKLLDNGVGLTNTRKRLEKMYGSKLAITELGKGGVVVCFLITAVGSRQ